MAVKASDCSTKARSSSKSEAVFLMLAPREELSSSFKSAAGRQCEPGRQMCRKNGSPGHATGRGWPGSGHFQGNFVTISGQWDVSKATFVTEESECQERSILYSLLTFSSAQERGGESESIPRPLTEKQWPWEFTSISVHFEWAQREGCAIMLLEFP